MAEFSVVVEGTTDESAIRVVLEECGHSTGRVFGRRGRDYIQKKIQGYNDAAALGSPWLVVVDLDRDDCPGGLIGQWLPDRSEHLTFRVAVRMLEAWLLGDAERASSFLGVAVSRIPADPDTLSDPKKSVIELAKKSRKSDIRKGIPPKEGSGARVGPTYGADLTNYASNLWRPNVAAQNSQSLEKCMRRLREVP